MATNNREFKEVQYISMLLPGLISSDAASGAEITYFYLKSMLEENISAGLKAVNETKTQQSLAVFMPSMLR